MVETDGHKISVEDRETLTFTDTQKDTKLWSHETREGHLYHRGRNETIKDQTQERTGRTVGT